MRGMREMVRKAGTALLMLFHSMCTTLIIIRLPVRISAGPVQYTGMLAAHPGHIPHVRCPACVLGGGGFVTARRVAACSIRSNNPACLVEGRLSATALPTRLVKLARPPHR